MSYLIVIFIQTYNTHLFIQSIQHFIKYLFNQKMNNQMIQLRQTNYYMIINKATGLSIYLNSNLKNFEKEKVTLAKPDESDLGHVWMIVELEKFPNMFEIVHTVSTLVLTFDSNAMRVATAKWKSSQLYFLQRHDPKKHPNQFYLRLEKDSNKFLTFDKELTIRETSKPDETSIWELVLVKQNDIINRSCYIEYAHSNMVLDVPRASDKPGTQIIQYPCNNRFNQRWVLKKFNGYYLIENLKTKMYLDIKGQNKKPGGSIIQWKYTGGNNQLWSLDYQGKGIYLIRSVLNENLMLAVKHHSLKEEADIVTTDDDSECLWRIVGYVPS